MSGVPMSPDGIWSLYLLGGGEGGDDGLGVLVAYHSGQPACLRASSPWPQGHTVQRPSRRDAWNWAVDRLKAKDPSLLVRGRRAWGPPRPVGKLDRPRWRCPSLRVELRAKGACLLGTGLILTIACVSSVSRVWSLAKVLSPDMHPTDSERASAFA